MNHNSFRFGNFFVRSHCQHSQVAGNHPSAVPGQALLRARNEEHAEGNECARDGIPTTNRALFIAAL
ncbi:MAG TPA: hypothetical protein VKP67_14050, partial [Xanthobacteraceae bacterium]|nr:hypothetical protein [Xanthobacteraceae bacterium]